MKVLTWHKVGLSGHHLVEIASLIREEPWYPLYRRSKTLRCRGEEKIFVLGINL